MNDFPFEPRTTKFSKHNALCCAKASALAYEDEGDVKKQTDKWGFEKFKFFDCSGTQAFIAANEEMILVSFRGTEPTKLQDLVADANLFKTPGPAGRVHTGFLKALNHVMEDVHKAIRDYKEEYAKKLQGDTSKLPPSLWITGRRSGYFGSG